VVKEAVKEWEIGDRNKSQVFIFPILGGFALDYCGPNLPHKQFRNCFIGDKSEGIENRIILLYKFTNIKLYVEFERKLMDHPLFEKMYEPDKSHTCYVFKIPPDKQKDYNYIVSGKYSMVSERFKKDVLTFHGNKIRDQIIPLSYDGKVGGILYRTNKRRMDIQAEINKGLPTFQHIKIDRDTELESLFDDNIEYYQDKFKIIKAIKPNNEFNSEV